MPAYGEMIIVLTPKGKRRILRLEEGKDLHTGEGVLHAHVMAAAGFGEEVRTSLGVPLRIQRPTIHDLMRGVKRQTQIIYPKDACYICLRLGVGPGRTVIEAGSGSGALTVCLSWLTGPAGHVYSFEAREEFGNLARRNLDWAGLGANVTLLRRDIEHGFAPVTDADALFLDVRTPWEYLRHIPEAVRPGAAVAFLLPTAGQVEMLLRGLEKGPFDDVDVCELLLRRWKTTPDRLRPDDRMIAHTGFLIFARHQEKSTAWDEHRPLGTRERKQEAARRARLAPNGADGTGEPNEPNEPDEADKANDTD
jgi:tRNA (adenine57-N1/adenine58-N1)-methyltransferase